MDYIITSSMCIVRYKDIISHTNTITDTNTLY